DQGHALTLRDGEVQVVQHGVVTEALDDVGELDVRRVRCGPEGGDALLRLEPPATCGGRALVVLRQVSSPVSGCGRTWGSWRSGRSYLPSSAVPCTGRCSRRS